MVDRKIAQTIRHFIREAKSAGIHVESALLYGSYAKGTAGVDSDIDLAVIAPEFDRKGSRAWVRKLWALRAITDNRIEPLAVGRTQWLEDQGSPIIEIVRREGISIALR